MFHKYSRYYNFPIIHDSEFFELILCCLNTISFLEVIFNSKLRIWIENQNFLWKFKYLYNRYLHDYMISPLHVRVTDIQGESTQIASIDCLKKSELWEFTEINGNNSAEILPRWRYYWFNWLLSNGTTPIYCVFEFKVKFWADFSYDFLYLKFTFFEIFKFFPVQNNVCWHYNINYFCLSVSFRLSIVCEFLVENGLL